MAYGKYNANQYQPIQDVGSSHPPGRFQAMISGAEIKATQANDGGYLAVEFTTPAGKIINRYNLWNKSPAAVDISQKQLSTLCRATGRYELDFDNPNIPAFGLGGGQCQIEVVPQKDKEGKENGYTEIKMILDMAGNDPAKPGQQQAPQQTMQPQGGAVQQPAQQGWGAAPQQQAAPPQQGWTPAQVQQPAQQPVQQQQPQQSGWGNPPAGNPAPASSAPWSR